MRKMILKIRLFLMDQDLLYSLAALMLFVKADLEENPEEDGRLLAEVNFWLACCPRDIVRVAGLIYGDCI